MRKESPSLGAAQFARLVSATAFLVGLAVLTGWMLKVPLLTRIRPDWPQMVPLTALTFVLASISLWFMAPGRDAAPMQSSRPGRLRHQRISAACGALVALIGVARLAAHLFGWSRLQMDSLGLPGPSSLSGSTTGASMAPATAVAFALSGGALLAARRTQLTRTHQAFAILVLLIGWLGCARYVVGGPPLASWGAMALHTAAMFLLLGAGALSVRPDAGLMSLLLSRGAGASSARHMLPAALLVPVGAGALALYSERAGWLGVEADISLFSLSSVVLFAGLVWASAAHLERTDRERQHAQSALEGSEERTRLIVENALDAVITIDSTGIISGWNAQAESLFGWSRAEVLDRPLAETIIPERYREAHQRGLRRYLETGEARVLNRRIELAAVRRDRGEFQVEIAIIPLRGGDNTAFSAFVRDITERTRAELALRQSQQLLQAIVDNSQAVVYVKDLEGRYLLVNRRFEEIFLLTREAVLGRTDHHFFAKDAADAFRDMDVRVADAKQALTEEETVPQTDGQHVYISVKAPLRDAAGKTYGIFGISTDITEQKKAERRLRTQLERLNLLDRTTRAIGERQDLRSVFRVVISSLEEHLPIDFGCICLHEGAQQALTVECVGVKSQALTSELGLYERARIDVDENGLGRCVRGELVYEPDIDSSRFPFPARLARGGLHAVVFAPLVVEGKVFAVMIAARRAAESFTSGDCEFVRQLSGHVALAAHQAQLYMALQRAYEDLRQTQQTVMQQERLRALGQMASGIAHDINNALSPAMLYLQMLLERDPALSRQGREYLAVTQRAIEDVANTVARMREFSRPREQELTLAPVDLNLVLQQVIDLTHARWSDMPQERGVLIRMQEEFASPLPAIMGAENEIRDALTNLVLNAVDAMPDGGTLTLRSRSSNGGAGPRTASLSAPQVSVEVSDTGIGMSEPVRSRCLEPFFTTKGERGTGLGLAMVYGMIQRHSAELQIDSEPGAGTTMRLIFPSAATSVISQSGAHVRPPRPLRILVVDDDPLLLRSLQDTLQQDGHGITVAEGGQAGIDEFRAAQLRGSPFIAVITDLGMPNIDGRTVAAAVKTMAANTPVILLTGWGYRLKAENDLPQHVDRVLSKPPKLSDLRAALAELTSEGASGS
jgi:PAS domain S-box-containing protein